MSELRSDDETVIQQADATPAKGFSTKIVDGDIVCVVSGQYKGHFGKVLGKTPSAEYEVKVNYLEKVCVAGTKNTSTIYYKVRRYDMDSKMLTELKKLNFDECYVEDDRYCIYQN